MNSKILMLGAALLASACSPNDGAYTPRQTNFPGMVTAGGGTSGEVMARNKKGTDGSYAGGTPYHAGGSGGNTGGAATGGAVSESGHGPSGPTAPPAGKQTPSGQ